MTNEELIAFVNEAQDSEERWRRKAIVFPYLYGASGECLKDHAVKVMDKKDAKRILDEFASRFEEVRRWMTLTTS